MMTDLSLYCLIIPVLPFLVHDRLGIPNSELQGYTSGLLAAFAAASLLSSPIAGIIADQTNTRQLPFLLGLFALLAATILLAVGQSISVIALARVLQGMSGAVVWTIGLAICLETVGPSKLGTTIGAVRGLKFVVYGCILTESRYGVSFLSVQSSHQPLVASYTEKRVLQVSSA